MFFICLILVTIAVILCDHLMKNKRHQLLSRDFKGPFRLPIIGNMYLYFNKKPEDIFNFTNLMRDKYGSCFRVWAGTRLAFVCSDPRYYEVIFNSSKNIAKNNMYSFLVPWLGEGLLLSSGKKWFNRRKIITPTFHFKILHQFVEVFNRQNKVFVDKLVAMSDSHTPFNIYPEISLMTLDVISETAMGTKINAQLNENSDYVNAVKEISYIISCRFIKIWMRPQFIFNLTSAKQRHDKCIEIMHKFTTNIIENRREALLKDDTTDFDIDDIENDDVGLKKKQALLDVLLKSTIDGKPLTNDEITEEVDTFMFEGHDTTTSAISFTLYLLSQNADVQQKVLEESRRILGNDRLVAPTYNQLQEMKYLEAVIKESLRIFPPVPMFGRFLEEDVTVDGYTIPAGVNFNMMIYLVNKDSKYYSEPEKFMPERFIETNDKNENPFIYTPFSAGPRNCIGQKFAMLELKSTLSSIVRNFELLPSIQKPKLIMQLVLKSSNGIHVGFKKR
ncbi:unnamed protein product [Diamesa serratosioi]